MDTLPKDIILSRQKIILDMFNKLGFKYSNMSDLHYTEYDRDLFINANVHEYLTFVPKLKEYFKSSKLDSLHSNSIQKQKFPVINIFRQILKCNDIHMKPKVLSIGYCKATGKKIYQRKFILIPIL